jgi:hypothetical protein
MKTRRGILRRPSPQKCFASRDKAGRWRFRPPQPHVAWISTKRKPIYTSGKWGAFPEEDILLPMYTQGRVIIVRIVFVGAVGENSS